MTRLTEQESALILADRHIAEALQRIAKQERLIQYQQEKAIESMRSDQLLRLMREVLCTFLEHRSLIQEEIERQRRSLCSFATLNAGEAELRPPTPYVRRS